jgi:hypothetical protein
MGLSCVKVSTNHALLSPAGLAACHETLTQVGIDRRPVVNDTFGVEEFEKVVEAFVGRDGVTLGTGRGFGGNTLQVDGRIFAMPNSQAWH